MEASFYPCNQPRLDQNYTKGRFSGQTVVVAGGASGIGFAAAHRLANDGASVAIVDCNKTLGESAVSHLKKEGFVANFYHADVVQKSSCVDAAKKIADDNGGTVHHLVNTVAYFCNKALEAEYDDWRKSFDVNVAGFANMVQACFPFMSKGSSIVNLSSISAVRAQPNRWTYSTTKGAIEALTKCMALDLSKKGIRVNAVAPAWIWTPEQAKASPDGTRMGQRDMVSNFHLLRREGETSEVAAVIAFLCSKDASFMTGSTVYVDGGYSAMGPEQHGESSKFGARDTQ
ncbi:dihydroanticapsin 7-dehydrogenase-like [Styela clava]